jgi:hypothetical protein
LDETRIIAWIDGELSPAEAAEVEAAVAADPELAVIAARHRRIRARFAAAFNPLLDEPAARPLRARVVSPAAVRAEKAERSVSPPRSVWLNVGIAAAAILIGLLVGRATTPRGIADRGDALALSTSMARALDRQTSDELGTVNVALSFRDHDGHFCRSFVAQYIGGVACKADDGWQIRYAAPVDAQRGDYRMAGSDPASARVIATMIAGAPLDAVGERKAIAAGWR